MEINHTHNGTDLNNPGQITNLKHSHIEMHPDFNHTIRFGENTPHLVFDVFPSDEKMRLRSRHAVNSYTLKAPLGQSVELHKDYFMVPHMCLLPLNSEKILQAPKTGDDVPEDANTVTRKLWTCISSLFTQSLTYSLGPVTGLFYYLWFVRTFFSRGCLLNYLGYSPKRSKFSFSFINSDDEEVTSCSDYYADDFLEFVLGWLATYCKGVQITYLDSQGNNRSLSFYSYDSSISDFSSFRDAFEFAFNNIDNLSSIAFFVDEDSSYLTGTFNLSADEDISDVDPFNYDRLCAYQIVNYHFYTNDNVDYIYNADMYREYIKSLTGTDNFSWNGYNLQYDSLSGHLMDTILDDITAGFSTIDDIPRSYMAYFSAIFSYRQSLRFVDYFTGARTRPLAIGEEGVAVHDGFVSAIDIAQEMQRTRYLNAVNRSSRNADEYNEDMFGVKMDYDYHNPMWLGSTSDVIYNSIVENTADEQYNSTDSIAITGQFRSNAERFAFEFSSDVRGIVIGIEYCDIKRVYTDIRDRSFFVANRYDSFIPQMQYIGDQPIYKKELGFDVSIDDPSNTFGYTTRDMQYKCAVSRAVGGFDGALPGWSFAVNASNLKSLINADNTINPDFIRARSTEFDQFYLRLTGYSPRNYFHFIVFAVNDIEINRPMVMNPQILG